MGCSVEREVCSVCGEALGKCHHVKGRTYNGKLCCPLPVDLVVAQPHREGVDLPGLQLLLALHVDKRQVLRADPLLSLEQGR